MLNRLRDLVGDWYYLGIGAHFALLAAIFTLALFLIMEPENKKQGQEPTDQAEISCPKVTE